MPTTERPEPRGPMSNERLTGHAIAAFCGLLAAVFVVPNGSDGSAYATLALTGVLGLLVLNAAALGVRANSHDRAWALANAACVAVGFVGSVLALDAGFDFTMNPPAGLWVQLFIALAGGSALVSAKRS